MNILKTLMNGIWKQTKGTLLLILFYVIPFMGMTYYLDTSFSQAYAELFQTIDRSKIKLIMMVK